MNDRQPVLRAFPGWSIEVTQPAKTDGLGTWWYEMLKDDGSIFRVPLMPDPAIDLAILTKGPKK